VSVPFPTELKKKNIGLFVSSTDQFFLLGIWEKRRWKKKNAALERTDGLGKTAANQEPSATRDTIVETDETGDWERTGGMSVREIVLSAP
jgi:hypothetical protein